MSRPERAENPARCESLPAIDHLILASASPARTALLTGAGVVFTVAPASIDEAAVRHAAARRGHDVACTAKRLAWLKARQVARRTALHHASRRWVIGADQMLELDGAWFDKPGSLDAAAAQLRRLQGRTHRLWSAFSLWCDGREVATDVETASLSMRPLTEADIARSVAAEGEALCGCVGAYRIESDGAALFTRVEGRQSVIMGLPLEMLLARLTGHDVEIGHRNPISTLPGA
jgi:septum formation protein